MKLLILIGCCLLLPNTLQASDQKVVFCVESVNYKSGTGADACQGACNANYGSLQIDSVLSDGWKIVSSSPKEASGIDCSLSGNSGCGCTCVGTQYVIQKDNHAPIVTTPNKETELLQKEIDLLKQDNENLKDKLKSNKKKK